MSEYIIKETPCYPCKWKVVRLGYKEDNATYRYHRTYKEAMEQIKKFENK